ncbi:zinc-ribbon domain-containing protein [Geochorda subterranea]|uniref:Zinc-ribbon domain-containing protein n=1 Tax=Geochorda subterranea TaxID=3109564 RepID=A0ABZ1BQY2_9FIRM|nr:hypothetical protein [Limnochorda sp. LNt]WRP15220.1 hypothetical protein VLY81_03360 [Limnochorda sp. LNt]
MVCRDCGTHNYSGSLYCKKCGADLNRKSAQTPVARKNLLQLLLSTLR